MRRPATKNDVLDIAKGHLDKGGVYHIKCGGKVIYSWGMERFHCTSCLANWAIKMVKASTTKPYETTFWAPPMEFDDGIVQAG
jgi:hypothetical protein